MKFDGASTGVGAAKSTGFDYSFAFNDKGDKDVKEKDFRDMPPIFNVAFNHSTGGRDDGAFNA